MKEDGFDLVHRKEPGFLSILAERMLAFMTAPRGLLLPASRSRRVDRS